jgi:hypothetical protein
MGNKSKFRTNHHGMLHLFEYPSLNARDTRLLEFLFEFDF